ncbi:amidohydrolase family protein [Algoriphagus sp. Y33]|uniref:amidohydrolase family protein n=1 Tax=Algoriphagus sp. Y33 TaxID=2772483 RepID=UPI0017834ED3|nr:amidohydrolase family protein [Algoriphagus sp. Y33]
MKQTKKIKRFLLLLLGVLLMQTGMAQETFPKNGVSDLRQGEYALINATAVTSDKTVNNAVILIKGKKIIKLEAGLAVPKGFKVIDLKGKYVYPAFIDVYSNYGMPEVVMPPRTNPVIKREQIIPARAGAYNANDAIKADFDAGRAFALDQKKAKALRDQGIGTVSSFRPDGVARGTSVVLSLGEDQENELILKNEVSAYFSMDKGSSLQDYPHTLMGGISLMRQTWFDALWYGQLEEKPFVDLTLEALNRQLGIPWYFESPDWSMTLTVDKVSKELGKDFIIKGAGDEYQRIDKIREMGRQMVIPLNFPKSFDVSDSLFHDLISLKDMKHWEMAPLNLAYLAKNEVDFAITADGLDDPKVFLDHLKIAVASGLGANKALEALTKTPARFLGMENVLGGLEEGMYGNMIISTGPIFDFGSQLTEIWVQGKNYKVSAKSTLDSAYVPAVTIDDNPEMLYPFTAFGSEELPTSETMLIKGVTVWTNTEKGILKNHDVLIENGKISKVGENLKAGKVRVIDGTGRHLSAGIIDEHAHIALKAINEMAINTSMVRMADVVNPEDIAIYRALAGGVVAAQLLHGSSDAIGGQSALVKLKWGGTAQDMMIDGADKFIKFALGENPKRSKSDPSIRFPRTIMGLEQVYTDAFTNALEYEKLWKGVSTDGSSDKSASIPRRDLVNEAMLEIIHKRLFITSHSYVQSEMLMLMDVADRFDFTINTFTHVLEGYKIANEMQAHGVGGSTFSDRWNYKWEARNAIPYNTVLMSGQGVVTAVNSDSGETIRHLNQEAAKSIKYGGMDEQEALKLATLNPAILLHLDETMGTVEEGKSADIVLWSDSPLSIYAKAEKTIIEGAVYFDMERDLELRAQVAAERRRILSKMKMWSDKGGETVKVSSAVPIEMECDFLDAESLMEMLK